MSHVIYFPATCYLLLLQCTSSAHTSPTLSLLFFMRWHFSLYKLLIETRKKREKLLQLCSRVGKTCFGTLKGEVSADGDDKRSSGVDDLARHEPPSQVLALTLRCHMWLHVAYGV